MANRVKLGETVFSVGDRVKVHSKIREDEKERTVIFDGVVIAIRGREENKSFIVRRVGAGKIGIERIFPLYSPSLVKIEVKQKGKSRRAKLYYLREKSRKEVRKKLQRKS